MVGRHSRRTGPGRRPFRRCGMGRETRSDVLNWSGDYPRVRKWFGDPPGSPEVVEIPSHSYRIGRETLPEFRKWSGDPPRGQEMVSRPSRRSRTGQETLPEVWKWSGDSPGDPEVVGRPTWRSGSGRRPSRGVKLVGRPSWRSGSGQESLPEVRKWLETLPEVQNCSETILDVWNWLGNSPGGPGVVGRSSRRSGSGR